MGARRDAASHSQIGVLLCLCYIYISIYIYIYILYICTSLQYKVTHHYNLMFSYGGGGRLLYVSAIPETQNLRRSARFGFSLQFLMA